MVTKKREYQTDNEGNIFLKCFKCGIFKPLEAFHKCEKYPYGVRSICKGCKHIEREKYYCKHKEEEKEHSYQWAKEHPARVQGKNKKRRERKQKEFGIDPRELHRRASYYVRRNKLRPPTCPFCGGGGVIEFHHPYYDDIDKRHIGVFCCKKCHSQIHQGKMEIQQVIDLLNI